MQILLLLASSIAQRTSSEIRLEINAKLEACAYEIPPKIRSQCQTFINRKENDPTVRHDTWSGLLLDRKSEMSVYL